MNLEKVSNIEVSFRPGRDSNAINGTADICAGLGMMVMFLEVHQNQFNPIITLIAILNIVYAVMASGLANTAGKNNDSESGF